MIFSPLFWSIVFIALLLYLLAKPRNKKVDPDQNKQWYLQFALSREDAVSQWLILLSYFFLGTTLLTFNRNLGSPVDNNIIILIASAIGLAVAYYVKTIYTLLFSLIGLTSWWGAQAVQWADGKNIKIAAVFAGLSFLALIFYPLGYLHEKPIRFKRFALVYLGLGITIITTILFTFSTKQGIDIIGGMTKGASFLGSWQLTLSLLVFLASLIGLSLYATTQKALLPVELLVIFTLACLFGITPLLPKQTMFAQALRHSSGGEFSSTGLLWALTYNLALFLELLSLLVSGYLRRKTWLINLGALLIFLFVIVKYFDWFFTFIDKSIFFTGAGILLLVVGGLMEKTRRYMISSVKTERQDVSQK